MYRAFFCLSVIMGAEIQRRYIMNRLVKRFFSVLFAFILMIGSFTAVTAEDPSITLSDTQVFVKTGETVTIPYTLTGEGEVSVGSVNVFSSVAETDLDIAVTKTGNSFTVNAKAGSGYACADILLNDVVYCSLVIYVYEDSNGCDLNEPDDVIFPLNYGHVSTGLFTDPPEAMYMPVNVTSSDPTVVTAEKPVMAAVHLEFTLHKAGTSVITVTAGSQIRTFKITVLPEGDYADYVEFEDGITSFSIVKGSSMKIPVTMKSYSGTCADDQITFEIEYDTNGSGTVTLGSDGTVKANKAGHVSISVSTKTGQKGNCLIYVYEVPKSISFAEDVYYLRQDSEWIEYPWAEVQPDEAIEALLVYTSSDESIIKVTMDGNHPEYTFVKPGEVTIRAASKDDPSVYGEFRAKAINAEYPDQISVPSSVTLYPDFEYVIPVTYTPFESIHEITGTSFSDSSVAIVSETNADGVYVTGVKPGKTVLTIKAGPKASAKVSIEVKAGLPEHNNVFRAGVAELHAYSEAPQEFTDSFTFVKDKIYCIEVYKLFPSDLHYYGDKDLIQTDVKKVLETDGLFEILDIERGPFFYDAWVKPVKKGSTSAELMKGIKKTLIVTDGTAVQMHRLYNPNSGEHFYTGNTGEKDALVTFGWQYEGIGWKAPDISAKPVYRLYNENAGDHHYTMNGGERDALVKVGWKYEGIGWYSDDNEEVPLYRQYNPNAVSGSHNYTTNKKENDALVKIGWIAEGIGWYGIK